MKIKTMMGQAQLGFAFVAECVAVVARPAVMSLNLCTGAGRKAKHTDWMSAGNERTTEGRYAEWLEWAAPLSGSGVVVNGGGK